MIVPIVNYRYSPPEKNGDSGISSIVVFLLVFFLKNCFYKTRIYKSRKTVVISAFC